MSRVSQFIAARLPKSVHHPAMKVILPLAAVAPAALFVVLWKVLNSEFLPYIGEGYDGRPACLTAGVLFYLWVFFGIKNSQEEKQGEGRVMPHVQRVYWNLVTACVAIPGGRLLFSFLPPWDNAIGGVIGTFTGYAITDRLFNVGRGRFVHARGTVLITAQEAIRQLGQLVRGSEPSIRFAGNTLPGETATGNILTVGAIGTGKTRLHREVIRSLVPHIQPQSDRRLLIYDVKCDLLAELYDMAPPCEVLVFNPFDRRSVGWDIAADVRTPEQARHFAEAFILPAKGDDNARHAPLPLGHRSIGPSYRGPRPHHNGGMGHTQQLFTWERTEPAQPKPEPAPETNPLRGVSAPAMIPRTEKLRPADPPHDIRADDRPAVTRRPHQSREEKHAHIEEMTERALTRLGESLAAGKSETLTQYLAAMAKFHEYSFGNQMLIAFQAPHATHVAGFHTWKSLGRSVKKGEHGIMILAPITRKVSEIEERNDDGTAETKDVRRIVNVKPVYVFDISQTEGKELLQFAKVRGDPAEATTKLKAFIKAKGIEIDYSPSLGGAEGRSEGGRIVVKQGHTPAEEFHVLVHEVAHELLHRGERRKETTKRSRELEAEAVAFVVCSAVGLDAVRSSTDYIHLYRGDTAALAESMEHIRRTANEILAAVGPASELRPQAEAPHRRPNSRKSPAALPEPEPLDAAVEKGNFGEDEYGPVRPTPEEVRAITEHHAERLIDVLTRLQAAERQLSRGSGVGSRAELVREKDRLLCAYQSGIALYEEDFGDSAARRLDAHVRHEVDKE